MRHRRFSIRSAAAVGAVAAVTIAGQTAASAAAASQRPSTSHSTASAAPNAAPGPDGGPGHWSQISNQTSTIAEAGLVRGTDGVLHVLWENGTANGHQGIADTPIAPDGAVGHATVIVSGQTQVSFPDATATPGGLDAFWNGTKTSTGPTGIFEATRPARGGQWSLGKTIIPENAQSSSVTAATASDGMPWVAFTGDFGMSLIHLGQLQDTVQSACCVMYPGIGTDGVTGTSYVAYMSIIPGAAGIWARPLSRTAVTGKAFRLPGSATKGNIFSFSQRIGITGRGHGRVGVYVSYGVGWPIPTELVVYRIGASKPFPLAKFTEFGPELANSTITAGPNGRLWAVWADGAGGSAQALFVRASNPAATAWSPMGGVRLPKGTQTIWRAYASAQNARVDVVALLTVNGRTAFYATQALVPPTPKKAATAAPQAWRITKTVTSPPKNGFFGAMVATGKNTAWAFDSSGNSTAEPTAWVLGGGTWSKAPFPGANDEQVIDAHATSPNDVWAFTESFAAHTASGVLSRVLHWNGHAWKVVKTFPDVITQGAETAPNDVWVFGEGGLNNAYYYNGHTWTFEGNDVDGGSVLAANDAWGFAGTFVEHWPGHKWVATNVASLLPRKTAANGPQVTGIIALSNTNVYAFGNGFASNGCGPTVILHFDGHTWRRVAQGSFGCGPLVQTAVPDGLGGLWLPMPDISSLPSYLVHYLNGKLTQASLPGGFLQYEIESVAHFPGTTRSLAGGVRHKAGNPNASLGAVILQYS